MREIDVALTRWRSEWQAHASSVSDEVIDEMERHLRDSILARLEDDKQETESAIMLAMAEFGTPEALIGEFDKVPSKALPWWPVKLAWAILVVAAIAAVTLVVNSSQYSNANLLIRSHIALVSFGYAAVVGVGVLSILFLCCRLFSDPLPGQKRMFGKTARVLCAISAIALICGISLGATSLISTTIPYSWLTTRDVGGLLILIWVVFMITRFNVDRIHDLQRTALAGLVANLGVLVGCQAAMVAHGTSLVETPVLMAVLVSHGAIALTAFAPTNVLSEFVNDC